MLAVEIEYRLVIKGEPVVCTRDELMQLYEELGSILQLTQPAAPARERETFADDPRPSSGMWTRDDDEALIRMLNAERPPEVVAGLLGRSRREIEDRYHTLMQGS